MPNADPSSRRRKIARALLAAALVFTLVMALLPQPPQLPGRPSDKLQHILAFVVLAGLAAAAYPRRLLAAVAALALFGGLIELLQAIPGLNRDSQLGDWIADTVAAALTVSLVAIVRAARNRDFARLR